MRVIPRARFLIYRCQCDSVNAPFPPRPSGDYIVIEVIYGNGRGDYAGNARRVRMSDCGSEVRLARPRSEMLISNAMRGHPRGFVRKNYRDTGDNSFE